MSKYVDFKEMGRKLATQDWWLSEEQTRKADEELKRYTGYMNMIQKIQEDQIMKLGKPLWKVDAGSNSVAYDGPTDK